jgi:hypothetical protein
MGYPALLQRKGSLQHTKLEFWAAYDADSLALYTDTLYVKAKRH